VATLRPMDPDGTPAEGRSAPDERTAADRDDDRMPRWIPRLLLLIVLTYFAALLALTAFRALRNVILWLIAALFLSFALEPAVSRRRSSSSAWPCSPSWRWVRWCRS
jgi:hypothetical protein